MSDDVADPRTRTVRLCDRPCSTCVIFPDDRMHLGEENRLAFLQQALDNDGTVTCHQTLNSGRAAICRGFANQFRGQTFPLRLIEVAPQLVEFVDPDSYK